MPSILVILLLVFLGANFDVSTGVNVKRQRCRSSHDLGRIPWFLPNSTFHNFGFPLHRTVCAISEPLSSSYASLGCKNVGTTEYLYESVQDFRAGNLSSTIIIDPHLMQVPNVASSGSYVIMAMYEILLDLGYQPSVRHWSEPMNGMFPNHVAMEAMKVSRLDEAASRGQGASPFATMLNYLMLQIEVPFNSYAHSPVNPSPHGRTFKWIIGLHESQQHVVYHLSDAASHCIGANFFLGRGMMCSNAGVITCPQYDFHRTRSLEVTPDTRKSMKKNIILFDDDQVDIDMERLRTDVMKLGGLDDLVVYKNQGRDKTAMPDLYKQVKLVIDCRNPGVEFINYESVLYDVMTLSCDMRATRNVFDFPVPSKYHIDPRNWTNLVPLVHDLMINYETRVDDFKHFKRVSRSSSQLAKTQVDIHYFSRDVLFRTYCASYAECRRVYPWAVAVWTLYPMAMIEVVTEMDLRQEQLDSDFIRITMSDLFTSKYFRTYSAVSGVAPLDMFPRTPCAYMVYMDPSFIPFGRDFLNMHVAALAKDPRPIVYKHNDASGAIALAVMHARPYLKVFQERNGAKRTYMELNYLIHPVASGDAIAGLTKVYGPPDMLEGGYLARLSAGANFERANLEELLQRHPPLQSAPCDDISGPVDSSSTAATPVETMLRRRVTSVSTSRQSLSSYKPPTVTSPRHVPVFSRGSTAATPPRPPVAPPSEAHMHDSAQARSHPNHRHHHDRSFGSLHYRCAPPANLAIDAVYVPMPLLGDNTDNSSALSTASFWLTSSSPPLSFQTVFGTFSQTQIETIVQHLDPILQNINMRKLISVMPTDIADALRLFDAIDYPNVISLRDMEYPHWGEKCPK